MTDSETLSLYATMLWWWLAFLAVLLPIPIAGIFGMVTQMRPMDYRASPPPPPPPFTAFR